ncbi:DUF4255 domain-containing protein [Anabaena azotica]|uniref:DUF4255 domain-containing protein n=1 Tax=Anabaena azotica TaxID=197653 RepID=UPI0039A4E3BA
MSNSLAIAAVTTTIRNLLARSITEELGSGIVTTRPPDKARDNGDNTNQVNIFLYQTLPNAAWRNMDLPSRVKPGETGNPPLALNLYYLITAYAQDNEDIISHRLLGEVMRIFHDYPILNPADIRSALPESDLQNQIERVKITPQTLNLEEISKLWATFQTQYRISVAYEVSAILIDSSLPVRTPLPVLTRGFDDQGILAQANLLPAFPTLQSVQPPNQQPSVRLGESLILTGYHLQSEGNTIVRFANSRLQTSLDLIPLPGGNNTKIIVEIPLENQDLPAGFYTVTALLQQDGQQRVTNTLSFSLAPKIKQFEISESKILTLTCQPDIWTEQRVVLLLGDNELLPQIDYEVVNITQKTDTLRFNISNIPPGEYFLRLRVDGVDSLLINRTVQPPVFDTSQRVRVV